MPSPQSPGTCPAAWHSMYGDVGGPVSLPCTMFFVMLTLVIGTPVMLPAGAPVGTSDGFGVPWARMPSPVAPRIVKPLTDTFEEVIVKPLLRPDALMTAFWPSSVSGSATLTS